MARPLTHDDPQQLGAFRLITRLGGGGMGNVYLGRSPKGRTVALKTMHGRIATEAEFRTRFRLEIDAARVIGGRYGAVVVDADPFADVPWLATEYVLGPPLDDAVAVCGPLPERTVRALGAALCAALGQLHGSDVVHRDLKPSNILLTDLGPKVIDFGIARALGDDRLTRVGATAGTPAFMSPEQATGGEHTAAGDVFALAGVLVFAVTGHGPFGGGQAADLLYRVRYAEPDLTGVPAALLPVLTRCLSKDPAQRPGTAELARELDAQLPDDPEGFRELLPDTALAEIARRATDVWRIEPERLPAPAGTLVPGAAEPRMSRRKFLTLTGGSALGVAAVGAGAWAWSTRQENGPVPRPANVPSRAVWWAEIDKADAHEAPLPVGDLVLVKDDNGMVGLDAKTGEKRWTRTWEESSGGVPMNWPVASDGDHAYTFASGPDTAGQLALQPLDLGSGRAGRRIGLFPDFDGYVSNMAQPLAVAGGVIYLFAKKQQEPGTPNDRSKGWCLLAIRIRTGKELWRQPISGSYLPTSQNSREDFIAGFAAQRLLLTRRWDPSDELYASVRDALSARSPRTGKILWDWEIPRERLDSASSLDPGQLVADRERVYFGTGRLYAFRLSDGDQVWEFGKGRDTGNLAEDSRPYGRPAVKNGVVYVAEGTRGLVAVAADSGKPLWETGLGGDATPDLDITPVIGRKYAYVAHGGRAKISAIDLRTHKVAWTLRIPGNFDNVFVPHERARTLVWTSGAFVCAVPFE
ncbi:PQQ-binding-like beta-propeller repeat protein [Streptomyces sp. RTd22]|uniref:serine/threonine-protein kinase n=1 Tax=Streptomyces sp. RTd22 TaxID=1841249 RepID=UPI00099F6E6B|nr:serine/threonine-protein kinase [Streptomyces sp. RTd22]